MDFSSSQPLIVILAIAWSFFWKGMALWHSAQNKQRNWFIGLLVINTLGILEILYLNFWQEKRR
ncbi:MAG: DUF5652 family protein [bacterium]|nr:DUF5652 family protein [bacterium]